MNHDWHKYQEQLSSSWFKHVELFKHHTASYSKFVNEWLPTIIRDNCELNTVFDRQFHCLRMINYRVMRSSLLPSDTHVYEKSYLCHIIVDVVYSIFGLDENYDDGPELPSSAVVPDKAGCKKIIKRKFIPTEFFTVEISTKTTEGIHLVSIPLMTYSEACTLSCGVKTADGGNPSMPGAFIVNGKPRFLPLRKIVLNNFPLLSSKCRGEIEFRAVHPDRKHRSTSTMNICIPASKKKQFQCLQRGIKLGYKRHLIPIPIVVLALGWTLDEFRDAVRVAAAPFFQKDSNVRLIFYRYLLALDLGLNGCTSEQDACIFIGKIYGKTNNVSQAKYLMRKELFPNLNSIPGQPQHPKLKGFFLAYIYSLSVLAEEKKIRSSDLDCLSNCRILTTGNLMAILFRKEFRNFVKQGHQILRRRLKGNMDVDPSKIYNHVRFTTKMVSAMATGNWSKKRRGISHSLNTANSVALIAQLTRISSSCLNNAGKHIGPRMVHASQSGYIGAASTTENEDCGLISTLACTARVTTGDDQQRNWCVIERRLKLFNLLIPFAFPVSSTTLTRLQSSYKIFNTSGVFLGWTTRIDEVIRVLEHLKYTAQIDPTTTYHRLDTLFELRIHCDNGRLVRPLIVLGNIGKLPDVLKAVPHGVSPWPSLLSQGCIEFVSAGQEQSLRVTYRITPADLEAKTFTHLELTDVNFVGLIGALTPLWAHNQAPRLVHWLGMAKQVIGTGLYKDLGAPMTHCLWYGQRSVVATKIARDLHMDQEPNAMNLIVMITPEECNQEDAIVWNQAAIDRGLAVSSSSRTYSSEKFGNRYKRVNDRFEKPARSSTTGMAAGSYDKLQSTGFPLVGTELQTGDAVIGRSVAIKKINGSTMVNAPVHSGKRRRDRSTIVRKDDTGKVQRVTLAHKTNSELAKVVVRTTRIPEVADKFSSRHSQKCTIGITMAPEDMYFDPVTGMVADVIFGPPGLPSRMTMGMLWEGLFGMQAIINGNLLSVLDHQNMYLPIENRLESIVKAFNSVGLHSSGKRKVIDGRTGNMVEALIFVGCISYYKLNHMVSRKANVRSNGPVFRVTRGPTEGRKDEGGIRMGVMEFEALMAHGAGQTIKERLTTTADHHVMYVCKKCGKPADGNSLIKYYFCKGCNTGQHVRSVEIGYATKLFTQEIRCQGVNVTFELEDLEKEK